MATPKTLADWQIVKTFLENNAVKFEPILPTDFFANERRRIYDRMVFPLLEPLSYERKAASNMMTGNINQENYSMNEQYVNKGIFDTNISISPTCNGGFIINKGGYTNSAFTNADDLMAFLKIEAKKFNDGFEAEVAAKKAAAKKN